MRSLKIHRSTETQFHRNLGGEGGVSVFPVQIELAEGFVGWLFRAVFMGREFLSISIVRRVRGIICKPLRWNY
jgi:hypothetical protein